MRLLSADENTKQIARTDLAPQLVVKKKARSKHLRINALMAASSLLGWIVALALLTGLQAESSGKDPAAYLHDMTNAMEAIDDNLSPKTPHGDPERSNLRGLRLMDNTSPSIEKASTKSSTEVNGL